jgi:hypothetical protein
MATVVLCFTCPVPLLVVVENTCERTGLCCLHITRLASPSGSPAPDSSQRVVPTESAEWLQNSVVHVHPSVAYKQNGAS